MPPVQTCAHVNPLSPEPSQSYESSKPYKPYNPQNLALYFRHKLCLRAGMRTQKRYTQDMQLSVLQHPSLGRRLD